MSAAGQKRANGRLEFLRRAEIDDVRASGNDDEAGAGDAGGYQFGMIALEHIVLANDHQCRHAHLFEPADRPTSDAFWIFNVSSNSIRSARCENSFVAVSDSPCARRS